MISARIDRNALNAVLKQLQNSIDEDELDGFLKNHFLKECLPKAFILILVQESPKTT